MKTGFLLGAGFSRHAGMPLAHDFTSYAKGILDRGLENSYIPSRRPDNLKSLIDFTDVISSEKGRKISHIEELIELADERRWEDVYRQGRFINIDKEIRDAIYEILIASPYILYLKDKDKLYRIFDDYLRFLLMVIDCGAPIMTLNYDPLLELLLNTASMAPPSGPLFNYFAAVVGFNYNIGNFSYRTLPKSFQQNREIFDIEYFKLHGASNWEGCERHGLTEVCDPLKTSAIGTCKHCNLATKPLIVYPVKYKKLSNQQLELWVKAFRILEQMSQVIIIGCQFNETDKSLCDEIKILIKKGIKVIIVDPCGKEIKKRIAEKDDNVTYVDNDNGSGSLFEEIFCETSTAAKDKFRGITNLKLRENVNYFRDARPNSPFFQIPIEKD